MPRSGRAAVLAVLGLLIVAIGATAGPLLSTHPEANKTVLPPISPSNAPSPLPTAATIRQVLPSPAVHPPAQRDSTHLQLPLAVIVVVAALLLVGLAVLLWRTSAGSHAAQWQPPLPSPAEPAPTLREAAVSARAALDDGDPRSAVIRCWLALERAADTSGVPRSASDTPGELAAHVLAGHAVDAGALAQLRGLYQQARYSARPVGERERADARAAVDRVGAGLARIPERQQTTVGG